MEKELNYSVKFQSADTMTITNKQTGSRVSFSDGDALEIISELNSLFDRYMGTTK